MIENPLDTASLSRIDRGREAEVLATAAYTALLADLTRLTDEDWDRPTECAGWSVRDMVAHLVGAAQGHASLVVFMRQYMWGLRHRKAFAGSSLDAMNQRQIDELQTDSGGELTRRLARLAPKAVAGRVRRARLLGWAPISIDAAGSWYPGMPTRTTMGELCAIVLTRDVWAHRLDIARAVGRAPSIDPQVDGRLVADIVGDWAQRHGQPFHLSLAGDAGGMFEVGEGGDRLNLDALDFVRVMAGRRPDAEVPDSPLWATKVLF